MPLLFVLTPSQATVSAWVPRAALVTFSGPDASSYLLLKSFTPRRPYFDIICSDSSLTGFHPCPYSAFLMEGVGMPLPLEQSSWWNYVSPFSSYKFCYNKWAWLGANKALSTRTGLGQTWSVGSRVSSCWHIRDYRGTFLAGPPLFPHTAPDILPAIYWMPSSHWETFHWGISLQSCFLEGPGSFRHLTLTEA